MARQKETGRCSLGHDHVLRERVLCDHCGGVIGQAEARQVDWFGRGPGQVRLHPLMPREGRAPIVATYRSVIPGSPVVCLDFCSLTHFLEYFRSPHDWQHPNDRIEITAELRSWCQLPIKQVPPAEARPG